MISFYINLPNEVASALAKLARHEQRTPRDQITFVLKKELEWRGLLPAPDTTQATSAERSQ